MEEIQIKEIIRVLIFSFSDGPGTPDWAEKNDIYQSYGDHQHKLDMVMAVTGRGVLNLFYY